MGVFGGSFDPPHVAHLVVAQDALEGLGLDRIRFVPAHRSPLKTEDPVRTSAETRLEMVRSATEDHPAFEVSRVEVDRPPPSYTVETLRRFREHEPEARFFLLLGADQWAEFGRWREPIEIARLAAVVVLTRDGRPVKAAPAGVAFRTLPVTRFDLSSSELRQRVGAGRSIRYLVSEAVREIIAAKGLYTTC